ncbi:universal stress protein [Actinoplanes sp. NPDC023801]|uniref:universal stress protein n=1 Tax=Actinoplanes sp. NPDC023801 TaxID=3154595 RepID=UPI0033EEFD0B
MKIPSDGPVVVGVGDPVTDAAAVRLAAREAASRGRVLQVVHAFAGPGDAGWGPARRVASHVVDEAVSIAQRSTPGVDARGQLVDGPPARVLLRLSRGAVLVVVGGPLVEVVARAWCPVAVTRTPRTPSGPVLAAVDGSPCSVLVLRFAAEAADRRGGPVHVVHVAAPEREEDGERVLDEVLARAPWATAVRRLLLTGPPDATLVRASGKAGMIVLGPRGATATRRLGTTAGEVLHRAACPAVFVHGASPPAGFVKPGDGVPVLLPLTHT